MTRITDYLKKDKTKTLQIPVPCKLVDEVRGHMAEDGLKTWSEFFVGVCEYYINEKKAESSSLTNLNVVQTEPHAVAGRE